jgi:hypothetical protein
MTVAMAENLEELLPSYRTFAAILPRAALVLVGLVLGSGLALLTGRRWARTTAVGAAGLVLLTLGVTAIYESMMVLPAIERAHDSKVQRNLRQIPAPDLVSEDAHWVSLLLLIGGLILFLHAVTTLVVLMSPSVAETFRRGARHNTAED